MTAAKTADQKAVQAGQSADQALQGVNSLRSVIANIDDYKLATSASVPFKLNAYKLSDESKADLDKLVGDVKNNKRFFIAVEGYTDSTGSRQYNEELSRKRADAVRAEVALAPGVDHQRPAPRAAQDQRRAQAGRAGPHHDALPRLAHVSTMTRRGRMWQAGLP